MNIAMLLEMAADGLGTRVAFGARDDSLTYAGLRDAATAVATTLAATPRTVALLSETAPIVPVSLFGAAWAGVPYAPLNYRLPDDARQALLERLAPVVVADPAWLDLPADPARPFVDDPDGPAVLLFTSGTSAAPKAARLAHDQLLAYVFNTVEFASADEDEAVLVSVPPFHIAGVAAVLSSTYAGRRVVPLPRIRSRPVAGGRSGRGGDARLRRPHDARSHRGRDGRRPRRAGFRRCATWRTAGRGCPPRCSSRPSPCSPTPSS